MKSYLNRRKFYYCHKFERDCLKNYVTSRKIEVLSSLFFQKMKIALCLFEERFSRSRYLFINYFMGQKC